MRGGGRRKWDACRRVLLSIFDAGITIYMTNLKAAYPRCYILEESSGYGGAYVIPIPTKYVLVWFLAGSIVQVVTR